MTDDNKTVHITTDVLVASQWLKAGNLIAYPTESVWGLGCDAYDKSAVQQILNIKNRPIDKGLIVVTDSIDRLAPLMTCFNGNQRQHIVNSWINNQMSSSQQATTWLLPLAHINHNNTTNNNIPSWITGKHDSIAVRVIAHPLVKTLCEHMVSRRNPYGFIISTSCNPATKPPATTFDEAYAYFGEQVYYLQGDTLGYTQPSQIRNAINGKVIR